MDAAAALQGCGIVEYEDAACAVAAMEALHTKYHWTGGETTMVVEWMDPARHRQDRQHDDGELSAYLKFLLQQWPGLLPLCAVSANHIATAHRLRSDTP